MVGHHALTKKEKLSNLTSGKSYLTSERQIEVMQCQTEKVWKHRPRFYKHWNTSQCCTCVIEMYRDLLFSNSEP